MTSLEAHSEFLLKIFNDSLEEIKSLTDAQIQERIEGYKKEIRAYGKQASDPIPERIEERAENTSMVSEDIASNRT